MIHKSLFFFAGMYIVNFLVKLQITAFNLNPCCLRQKTQSKYYFLKTKKLEAVRYFLSPSSSTVTGQKMEGSSTHCSFQWAESRHDPVNMYNAACLSTHLNTGVQPIEPIADRRSVHLGILIAPTRRFTCTHLIGETGHVVEISWWCSIISCWGRLVAAAGCCWSHRTAAPLPEFILYIIALDRIITIVVVVCIAVLSCWIAMKVKRTVGCCESSGIILTKTGFRSRLQIISWCLGCAGWEGTTLHWRPVPHVQGRRRSTQKRGHIISRMGLPVLRVYSKSLLAMITTYPFLACAPHRVPALPPWS